MNGYNKKKLRTGITTGASAAAAAQAVVGFLFQGIKLNEVNLVNSLNETLKVPISSISTVSGGAQAMVIKDGGDDPDITHGLEIIVEARPIPAGIQLKGGLGVGVVSRPGLSVPVGKPAINPVPRQMIISAVEKILPKDRGVELTIQVPGGEKVALKTLNPRLGIIGGISILGTTGVVRPMSEESLKCSLVPLVEVAVAAGYHSLVLTPGRLGFLAAVKKYGFPEEAVVEISNYVGFMLEVCVDKGVKEVLLWGHHGKLIKVAAGVFHTHNKIADARLETLAAYAGLLGASPGVIREILSANTTNTALEVLIKENLIEILNIIAQQASRRASEYTGGQLEVGTALLDFKDKIIGIDEKARIIGGKLGWQNSQL